MTSNQNAKMYDYWIAQRNVVAKMRERLDGCTDMLVRANLKTLIGEEERKLVE
jgi:hypothetical protein